MQDFSKALEFVNKVGFIVRDYVNYPEIKLLNSKVSVVINNPNGLSSEDKDFAQTIEIEYTTILNSIDFATDADTGGKIYLPIQTRLRNHLIVGKQGSGKSKLIATQLVKDINQGRGICLFDPNGEMVEDVFKDLNEEQKKNTILIDLANKNNNFSLNLLDNQFSDKQNLEIVEELIYKMYDDSTSDDPLYSSYLKNSLLLLLQSGSSNTIADLIKVVTDEQFKNGLLEKSQNQDLKNFWATCSAASDYRSNLEIVSTEIVAKIDKFVGDEFLKEYLLSSKPSFDFASSITSNKNILIKLPVKIIGQEVVSILSFILFNRLKQAIEKRDTTNSEYFVYVDNFEKLADYDLLELLESSKSTKTGFVITANSLRKIMEALDEDIIDQILENTSIHSFFKTEYLDAEIISQWHNDQVDVDSLRDPIRYGGYIFFDDKALSFES